MIKARARSCLRSRRHAGRDGRRPHRHAQCRFWRARASSRCRSPGGRRLVGAGARALIARGFARAGREPRAGKAGRDCSTTSSTITTRISPTTAACFPASSPRSTARRRGLPAGRLHQQAGALLASAARRARNRRTLRLHLRAGHVWRRQARSDAADRDHRARRRRPRHARSWSAIPAPTSTPRARRGFRSSPSISAIPTRRCRARPRPRHLAFRRTLASARRDRARRASADERALALTWRAPAAVNEALGFGRLAQRESTPFTREGSQVRSLHRPPSTH